MGLTRLINELKKKGLDRKKFNTTLKNLKYSNDVISFYVTKNLEKNTLHSYKKNRIILNKDFFKQPYEVVFRSLSYCLKTISKKYYSVRGKKLDTILVKIKNNKFSKQNFE
jgi:tRNA(Ile)-lysidine synthase